MSNPQPNISRASRRHTGSMPPSEEISIFGPGPGHGCT